MDKEPNPLSAIFVAGEKGSELITGVVENLYGAPLTAELLEKYGMMLNLRRAPDESDDNFRKRLLKKVKSGFGSQSEEDDC